MHRILSLLFFLMLATTIPLADALAQSSPGRGAVGGAIIGGAIGGRRGAAVGAIAGAAVAITTGAMVVAGSARTADRIR
jgi:hypothetical protein